MAKKIIVELEETPYILHLTEQEEKTKPALEKLIKGTDITVVGTGFIDAITPVDQVEAFIDSLTKLGIAVTAITLWCNCTPANKKKYGCHHGEGGPRHADGWYSEIPDESPYKIFDDQEILPPENVKEIPAFVKVCNTRAKAYATEGMKEHWHYSPCFTPGLGIAVPNHWRRT